MSEEEKQEYSVELMVERMCESSKAILIDALSSASQRETARKLLSLENVLVYSSAQAKTTNDVRFSYSYTDFDIVPFAEELRVAHRLVSPQKTRMLPISDEEIQKRLLSGDFEYIVFRKECPVGEGVEVFPASEMINRFNDIIPKPDRNIVIPKAPR